jgi:hypothetical protein
MATATLASIASRPTESYWRRGASQAAGQGSSTCRTESLWLNEASWSAVRGSWARPGAYPLAVRQAEAACRYEPNNGDFLTTLGTAQYRNRQYAAALKTLTQSDKLNAARLKRSLPADLAFLSMTQFQLGRKADAVATLGRLRDTMKKLPFDREADDLLQEAERVVDPKK